MTNIRSLNLSNDFNSIKTLDTYMNGSRDSRIVLDEYKEYAGKIFVVEDSRKHVIGIVSISPVFWDRVFMIDHLAVMESHRGLGIGKSLITFILGEARELDTRILCVQTATWNRKAIGFYESLGFSKRAVFPEYIGDNNDMIWLDIDLQAGN